MSAPTDGFFITFDGVRLHYRKWEAADLEGADPRDPDPAPVEPRGILVYLHGLQSHSGWFGETCARLAEEGFEVYALDRRGSGESGGPRGHVARVSDVVRDHRLFLAWLRGERPGARITLLAHSWGGMLGVLLAGYARSREMVHGLVLIAPALAGRRRMMSLWGALRLLAWSVFRPTRMLPVPWDERTALTKDPERAEWIAKDPLHLTEVSMRFWWETAKLAAYMRMTAGNIERPVYCALGGDDALVDNARAIDVLRKMKNAENKVRIFDGAAHTLEFERAAPDVRAEILCFLDETLYPESHPRRRCAARGPDEPLA